MSDHYSIRCGTCGIDLDGYWRACDATWIVDHANALAALHDGDAYAEVQVDGQRVSTEWMARHHNHHLVVPDRYTEGCPMLHERAAAVRNGMGPNPGYKILAPRVHELLREIGIDPAQFYLCGPMRDPACRRAKCARRTVVKRLHAEGRTRIEIAQVTGLHPSTVSGHLRGGSDEAPKTLSQRVLELLAELRMSPDEFRVPGRPTRPDKLRALTARRVIVQRLRDEGLTLREIARACMTTHTTVQNYLHRSATRGAP